MELRRAKATARLAETGHLLMPERIARAGVYVLALPKRLDAVEALHHPRHVIMYGASRGLWLGSGGGDTVGEEKVPSVRRNEATLPACPERARSRYRCWKSSA